MSAVTDKLAAARLMACNKFGYFRAAIMMMVPKELPGIGTMATSEHGVMHYDPEAVMRWSVEEVALVIVHEVQHLLRKHAERGRRMKVTREEHRAWNQACDAEINDDLVAANVLRFPPEGVLPKHFDAPDGLTAEEYYRKGQAMQQPQSGAGKGKQKGKKGDQKGQGAGQGDSGEEGDEQSDQGTANGGGGGKGQKGRKIMNGDCGGCAGHGNAGDDAKDGRGAEINAAIQADDANEGRSDAEIERARKATAEAIRAAVAKGIGRVPAGFVLWAEAQLAAPKVDWRKKLSRLVRNAVAYRPGAVDLRYTRPSRRQAGVGYGPGRPVLPAYVQPVPRVAVVLDTSGSMCDDRTVGACLAEAQGVLRATGAQLDFCVCDAAVHGLRPVNTTKEMIAMLKGGGGTAFAPAFDALTARKQRPDVCVFITDGYSCDAPEQPPYRVVWAIIGGGKPPVPWGEVVHIDDTADDEEDAA